MKKSMNITFNKNIIAIAFTVLHIIILVLNIDIKLPYFQNFRYAINSLVTDLIPLIIPVLVLTFLFTLNKEYKLKKWLLPIAFGIKIIISFFTLCSNFTIIDLGVSESTYAVMLTYSGLIFIASVFMFIGTLLDFKYINFLKYGALSCAILNLAAFIFDFIAVGGFEYFKRVPAGTPALNLLVLTEILTRIFFYIGISVLTINKDRDDSLSHQNQSI